MATLDDEHEDALGVHEEIAGEETTGTVCAYELAELAEFEPAELLPGEEVLERSMADAAAAGAVYRELAGEGTPIGETDTLNAGSARNRGLTLVTRDERFRDVPGLETRDYWPVATGRTAGGDGRPRPRRSPLEPGACCRIRTRNPFARRRAN